jgi:Cu-processing system permease protein
VNQALTIALNTFRETIRDRVLAVILLFAASMIVATLWLASISLNQEARVAKDFGLLAVTGFGLIVAVFIGASLVRKEVDKRTVYILFSKPVGRGAFVVGKFLGLCLTLATVVAGMGVFLFLLVSVVQGRPAGWMLVASVFIWLQLTVVTAVTLFFSTVTSAILSSILGIGVFVAGQLSANVLSLTRLGHNFITEGAAWVIFILVPNLTGADVKAAAIGEVQPDWALIAAWSCYLVAYAVLALAGAWLVFRRKEF